MYTSGRIESDTRSLDLYLRYFPAFFAGIVVVLSVTFYTQQDENLRDREEIATSQTALMGLRVGIERRLEHDIYVIEEIAEFLSNRTPSSIENSHMSGQTLLALSPDFGEVAIVKDDIVIEHFGRGNDPSLHENMSFLDWKVANTSGPPLRGIHLPHIVQRRDGRKFIVSETPIEAGSADLVVVLIDIEEVMVQSRIFDVENHTFTIEDLSSGAYIFGTPQIDMQDALSETILIGDLRWQLRSIRTGGGRGGGVLTFFRSYYIVMLLGLVVIGPTAWACHLLHIKHQNQLEDRKREAHLRALSTRLGIALDASRIGISEVDPTTKRVSWDERTEELFGLGLTDDGAKLKTWWKKLHPKDRARAIKDFRSALAGSARVESELRVRLPDRSERHVRSIWSATGPENARILLNAQWDVTAENKNAEELINAHQVAVKRNKDLLRAKDQLEYMALHDPMTGLPNRRYFDDYVAGLDAPSTRGKRVIGILQIDLDSFKQVNDSHGHAAGDKVLAHAARAIDRCARDHDFVARTGGDEFVLFCWRDVGGSTQVEAELEHLAKRIISAVQQPIIIKGKIYKPAASIGIAPIKTASASWEALLAHADAALYQAKDIGRNRYAFDTNRPANPSFDIARGSEDIISGLEKSQFIPTYQPQFDARDQRLIGIEALARWHHPIRGILTPESFMPAAKLLKLEAEIDAQIMDQTLRDIEAWHDLGLVVPRIAVNISPRRLCSDTLISELRDINVPQGALSFELLESIFVGEDDEQLIENVESIKKLGISIEIDDFGTGFASIVSLLRLEPDRLKIDRSLVSPVLESQANRQVLRSIVEMARALEIEVLAEGVENPLQARVLRSIGCDALQGFGLGKPMCVGQMTKFLTRSQSGAAPIAVEM